MPTRSTRQQRAKTDKWRRSVEKKRLKPQKPPTLFETLNLTKTKCAVIVVALVFMAISFIYGIRNTVQARSSRGSPEMIQYRQKMSDLVASGMSEGEAMFQLYKNNEMPEYIRNWFEEQMEKSRINTEQEDGHQQPEVDPEIQKYISEFSKDRTFKQILLDAFSEEHSNDEGIDYVQGALYSTISSLKNQGKSAIEIAQMIDSLENRGEQEETSSEESNNEEEEDASHEKTEYIDGELLATIQSIINSININEQLEKNKWEAEKQEEELEMDREDEQQGSIEETEREGEEDEEEIEDVEPEQLNSDMSSEDL